MSKIESLSTIQSIIQVRHNGLRSINVEFDLGNQSIIEGYVLTAQARSSLERILNHFESQAPARSWTLTGPYGSGKSYFGLFLMNLMGKSLSAHDHVIEQLEIIDPLLSKRVRQTLNHGSTQGLLPVPITGYRAPLQECVKHGLLQSLKHLDGDGKIKPLLAELDHWSSETESRVILRWLKLFLEVISHSDYGYLGMQLVFDEMGKPLEFASAHPDQTDIYLLQELAELANRSNKVPFVFVGILHQAFENYANLLDSKTQREWGKVQGRFEDIAFQEPPTQQIRLLANTIEYLDQKSLNALMPNLKQFALDAVASGWCPPMLRGDEFAELAQKAYPLHPTSLVVLPYLFRRLAQNERSIFAYLASHEPAGFQEFINLHKTGTFIRLPELFDYLSANFQGRLYATGRARAITETMERLSNAANLTALEIDILKTIGMLSWLAEVSHFQANETSVLIALHSPQHSDSDIRQALHNLQVRSLVVFRRFNKTYSVWQGSDIDIEERLQKAYQQLSGSFSLAEAVQKYMQPRPIAARRHSYQTGTLRYFEVIYTDSFGHAQLNLEPAPGASGKVLLCLPGNYSDAEDFIRWAQDESLRGRPNLIVGIAERIGRLAELLYELRCLHWVAENTPELRDDTVARRELRTRLTAIETLVQNDLNRTLSPYRLTEATGCKWFYKGKEISAKANQGLSHLVSNICDELYTDSPKLWNEILNRRALSSQGAAARRNLIEAMLTQASKGNLGISGFPPERSMYESILKAGGLHHQKEDGNWEFFIIPSSDPLRLRPVWDLIQKFVFADTPEPRSVEELFNVLKEPPYGLSDGVLPVILCVFVIINQDELTLYQEGTLLPEPTIANWEVLLRRPDRYSVAGCKVSGTRLAIVERFARAYQVDPQTMPVVRSLVRGIKSLPEHTIRTNNLSKRALAVRTALEQARSPELLIFADLPVALGIAPFEQRHLIQEQVDTFFERLNSALTELASEMPRLVNWGRDKLLKACGLDEGEESWSIFRTLAADLAAQTTNPSLLPLLKRAMDTSEPLAALESVLAYIANRPPRTWTDADTDRFVAQADVFGKLFQAERNGQIASFNLSPEQHQRSLRLADELRLYLENQYTDDPKVLKIALQILAQEFFKKKEG